MFGSRMGSLPLVDDVHKLGVQSLEFVIEVEHELLRLIRLEVSLILKNFLAEVSVVLVILDGVHGEIVDGIEVVDGDGSVAETGLLEFEVVESHFDSLSVVLADFVVDSVPLVEASFEVSHVGISDGLSAHVVLLDGFGSLGHVAHELLCHMLDLLVLGSLGKFLLKPVSGLLVDMLKSLEVLLGGLSDLLSSVVFIIVRVLLLLFVTVLISFEGKRGCLGGGNRAGEFLGNVHKLFVKVSEFVLEL